MNADERRCPDSLTEQVLGAIFEVSNTLGAGFLENARGITPTPFAGYPVDAQRRRLEKENEQLEKNIASLDKQLSDEASLSRKPEHVVANMRAKRAEYKSQLTKNKAVLDALE